MPLVASTFVYHGHDKAVQTRSEEFGIRNFDTVQEALEAAKKDETIWKISFNVSEERIRLVRRTLPDQHGKEVQTEFILEGTQGADPEFGAKLGILILTEKNSLSIQSI